MTTWSRDKFSLISHMTEKKDLMDLQSLKREDLKNMLKEVAKTEKISLGKIKKAEMVDMILRHRKGLPVIDNSVEIQQLSQQTKDSATALQS